MALQNAPNTFSPEDDADASAARYCGTLLHPVHYVPVYLGYAC